MIIRIYGIPNCDTVKRARAWLQARPVPHEFHDFKKLGVPVAQVPAWAAAVGWARLVNRQGSTWRKLTDLERVQADDPLQAPALLAAQPSLIKRPVVQWPGGEISVGFDAEDWAVRLAA